MNRALRLRDTALEMIKELLQKATVKKELKAWALHRGPLIKVKQSNNPDLKQILSTLSGIGDLQEQTEALEGWEGSQRRDREPLDLEL
uniref:Uncharacterized protein n=1 Tax=Chromera velia CCMP2878 TaxID=1169474 RepID=A0A0G4HU19_9ALVE|eukprot:Cvel_8583.t1-p1 / transcript=Cvel_8583.t1 / gene=Cvel_8583 / organism=Chromera_velia_CCMP2878 / gene_product=hypothetical protein / transcript_product=hypothetical protein / location=Cvel_scaffold476:60778-61038(-) / protein_length=87 / sequence_SO=supercontig / SO=protein_coding / is_pseudo=false